MVIANLGSMVHLRFTLFAAVFSLLAVSVSPATAGHDRARRAFEAGEIVGLGEILSRIHATYRCRVLDVELSDGGRKTAPAAWVYGITVLTPDGNVLMLRVDARSAEILDVTGRGAEAARKMTPKRP